MTILLAVIFSAITIDSFNLYGDIISTNDSALLPLMPFLQRQGVR